MKIIPVIDILNGCVVHAVRGRRNEYQPLKSVLCSSCDPVDVALSFESVGFTGLYVADLDAILNRGNNLSSVKQIVNRTGLQLVVDSGVSDFDRVQSLLKSGVSKVVVGTETLRDLGFVEKAIGKFGEGRVVVSLDLKAGKVLSGVSIGSSFSPLEFAESLQNMGVSELIVLDLARVGSNKGVDSILVDEFLRHLKLKVFVGGGVCGIEDLKTLREMGVFGVLVATALHSGAITSGNLKCEGFL